MGTPELGSGRVNSSLLFDSSQLLLGTLSAGIRPLCSEASPAPTLRYSQPAFTTSFTVQSLYDEQKQPSAKSAEKSNHSYDPFTGNNSFLHTYFTIVKIELLVCQFKLVNTPSTILYRLP